MEKTSKINNGATIAPYTDPILSSSDNNNELFYAAASIPSEDPIQLYQELREEVSINGYSETINEAQILWKNEQDDIKKDYLRNVIEDPSISKNEKTQAIKNYEMSGIVSSTLQDKYFNDIVNEEILSNNWDNDEDLEQVEIEYSKLKVDQQYSKLLETAKQVLANNVVEDVDAKERVTIAQRIQETEKLEDMGDIGGILPLGLDAEFLAYTRMIIGESPIWLANMKDLFLYDNPDGVDKKTWGQIMEIVDAQNREDWSGEWQEGFNEMLLAMGYNQETINGTFVNKALTTVGEYIMSAAEYIHPEDPTKVAIFLELITAVAPFAIGKGVSVRAKKRAKLTVKKTMDELDAKDKAILNQKDPVDPNSPIATSGIGNKKVSKKLVDAGLKDFTGEIFKSMGLKIPQLIHYLTDPLGNISKTKGIGWITDASRIKELDLNSKRAREIAILNPALSDVPARKTYLQETINTLNSIIPDIPMVISNTFSIFTPTAKGFNTELAFRKTSQTDYKFNEAKKAADQLLEAVDEKADIFIQEVDIRGNIVKEWQRNSKAKVKASNVNGYRVIWKNNAVTNEGFFTGWGETISDRFSDTPRLLRYIPKAILNLKYAKDSTAKRYGPKSEFFAAYGSLAGNIEYRVNVSNLMKQAFLKRSQDILIRDMDKLSLKEKKIFGRVLEHQDTYINPTTKIRGLDYVTNADINKIAGATLSSIALKKIQTAAHQYRRFDKELYYYDNITYKNLLEQAGYTKSFYIDVNNTDTPIALPVKETFSMKADEFFGNTVDVMNFDLNKPVTTIVRPGENTHFMTDLDGKVGGQIYRLSKKHIHEGKVYNYGTFGAVKAGRVPNNVLPSRPGHVPRVHDEAYTLTSYPKEIFEDGHKRQVPKEYRDTGPSRIISFEGIKDFTKEQIRTFEINRGKVIQDMAPYAQVVAMRNTRREANAFARDNIPNYDPNRIYVLQKAKELSTDSLSDYYMMQERTAQGTRLRNQGIDFTIKSDPFATLMENVFATGSRSIDQLAIDQFKMEWVTEFGNNNPLLTVKDATPENIAALPSIGDADINLTQQAKLNDKFPISVDQIKPVGESIRAKEYHQAAIKSWNKIYLKEMGYAPGWLSTITRSTMDKLGDASEGLRGVPVVGAGKLLDVNKIIREGQKRPGTVVGVPLKVVTQFRIMFNTVKQAILQPMAALGPLLTVSNGNPLKFYRNIADTQGLASVYYSQLGMMKGKVNKDLNKIIDNLWTEDGIAGIQQMAEKGLKRKDFELLLQAAREQGLLNVSDHQFAKGLFVDRVRTLDKNKGVTSIIGEGLQEAGFSFGELINRFGMTVVALRNFEAKNPGKNWRTQANLNVIMYDAYRLSGGMTDVTAYGWQRSTPLRYVGQFASFGMKMNEAVWNRSATPFDVKQRVQLAAWNVAVWGTAPYALYNVVEMVASMFDGGNEAAVEFGKELEKLPISYHIWNQIGDYITNPTYDAEGNLVESEALPGEVFGVYGLEAFGVYSVVVKNIINLFQDDLETRDLGATLNFWKKLGPGYDFITTIYTNPYNFSVADRAELTLETTAELLPVVKGIWRSIMQLSHESVGLSGTGHELFGGQTTWETISQNMMSIPNRKQRNIYEQFEGKSEKSTKTRALAKEYVQYIFKLKGEKLTLDDVKKYIVTAKVHLNNVDFEMGSSEFSTFTDEVMRLVSRQRKSIAMQLAQDFKKTYNPRQAIYDEPTVQRIRELADILSREAPGLSGWISEQVKNMEEANKLSKENK